MRSSDVGMAVMVLAVGFLMGALSVLAVYSAISNNRLESERAEARKALDQAEQERDQANSRIQSYLQKQHEMNRSLEQGDEREDDKPIGTLRTGDEPKEGKGAQAAPDKEGEEKEPAPAEDAGKDAGQGEKKEQLPPPSPDDGDKRK
jgi:hypothetical protein